MSDPKVTHLGLPTDWDAVAEQFKDNAMSSPMAAGLLLSLKAECEAQHARAEKAEAELEAERLAHKFQRERADKWVAAYVRNVLELERMSTDRDELIAELQQTRVLLTALRTGDDDRVRRLRDGIATLAEEMCESGDLWGDLQVKAWAEQLRSLLSPINEVQA